MLSLADSRSRPRKKVSFFAGPDEGICTVAGAVISSCAIGDNDRRYARSRGVNKRPGRESTDRWR